MNGPSTLLWVALIGAMAFGLFQVKYAVQRLEDELARLNRELLASEEAVHVLRAEWSYLNRPERLATLAARHLALAPMTAQQIGGVEALPLRAGEAPPAGGAGIEGGQ
ncbi:MAG: hypothetical protein ACE5LF_06430 [Alphaproteobacteria bacterium]